MLGAAPVAADARRDSRCRRHDASTCGSSCATGSWRSQALARPARATPGPPAAPWLLRRALRRGARRGPAPNGTRPRLPAATPPCGRVGTIASGMTDTSARPRAASRMRRRAGSRTPPRSASSAPPCGSSLGVSPRRQSVKRRKCRRRTWHLQRAVAPDGRSRGTRAPAEDIGEIKCAGPRRPKPRDHCLMAGSLRSRLNSAYPGATRGQGC
jgi:hypothetical protein